MLEPEFTKDLETIRSILAVPRILDVVCRLTGMGYAAVARVTEDRWIACESLDHLKFGLPAGGELKVETTLCHEVRQQREVIVFDDVDSDDQYRNHHTPAIYGLKSYISMPILLGDGSFFGTLCAIDPKPAKLKNPLVLETLRLFADMIALQIDAHRKIEEAKESSDKLVLRDQFIAVLGHDLRNPIASVIGGARILEKEDLSEKSRSILGLMKASMMRAAELVENVMDFARGRLGNGFALRIEHELDLNGSLSVIVDETRAANPQSDIVSRFELPSGLPVDHNRLGQMLSNLIGNAVKYGDKNRPVTVVGEVNDGSLTLSVANYGEAIAPDTLAKIFEPFNRGTTADVQGLGLGLYICAEIAKAHGGRLTATSNDKETRFMFTMAVS